LGALLFGAVLTGCVVTPLWLSEFSGELQSEVLVEGCSIIPVELSVFAGVSGCLVTPVWLSELSVQL